MDPMTIMALIASASGGVGSMLGGVANGVGSWMAADAQRDAAGQAMDLQRQMWGQQQQQQAPWLQAGQSTLADMLRRMQSGGFDVDPQQIANDPGYQFRLQQGQRALERSAAARGGLNSGGTLRSLARYSQGVASDEYQNAWNRQQGAFQRMAHVAGMGQNAANNLGQMGGQYANNMSSLYGAQGNAEAARWTGLGNAVAGAVGGSTGAGMAGMGSLGSLIPGQGGR